MMWRAVLLGALAACFLFVLTVYTKQPSHARDWQPHLGVTPSVDTDAARIRIAPLRAWTYDAEGPRRTDWIEAGASFSTDELTRVWFVVEPHPGLAVMAHTLVLFEFGDGSLHGLTIEARKQSHEKFAPLAGAFRRFELVYVWATPKDLLTRRAVYLDHEIYIYELALSGEQARAYLSALVDRTAKIEARPRFYNTLHSNCTNELAKSAGLAWQPAFVLTGQADEALFEAGYIKGSSFEAAQAGADMTSVIRNLAALDEAAFNQALLEAMVAPQP